MSPTRIRRKDLPILLFAFVFCGCAPETAGPQDANPQKVGQAAAAKPTCPNCEAARAYAPGVVCDKDCVPPAAVPTPQCAPPAPVVRFDAVPYSYVRESREGAPVVYTQYVPVAQFPPAPLGETVQTGYVAPAPRAEVLVPNNKLQKRPVGNWERSVGNCQITLRFEEDRLYGTCTFKDKKDTFTLTMDADYNITRDNVLYGVITGSEATGREDAEEAVVYVDMPFSARVRQDGDLLTVKGVKFLERGVKSDDPKELIVIEGRYKRQPKPVASGY